MSPERYLFGVVACWLSNHVANAYITIKPVDTEVLIGDTTFLNCSVSDNSAQVWWYRYPVGKSTDGLTSVYKDGIILEPFHVRFRVENYASNGAFNLIIEKVEAQDAGLYNCQDDESLATANLIVLESLPNCSSNIVSEGFIGPNSCGLQKEMIQLSCSILYKGNIAPKLKWKRQQDRISMLNGQVCHEEATGRLVCYYTTEADIALDGYVFICEIDRNENPLRKCSTETVKIFHATEDKTIIPKVIGDEVICSTNSKYVDCNYKWIWCHQNRQEKISETSRLAVEKIGCHRCEATCRFKEFECVFVAMTIEASTDYVRFDFSAAIKVALIIIFTIAVAQLVIIGVFKRKRQDKNKK